ncbi:MAG: glycosyl hydrolase [Chloroflexota bacterium]
MWKTINAGTTWRAIFEDQPAYSIGCITLDPSNPEIVWVGTGENVSGRHVGWGDGVYRSRNGGQTWENMGLKKSEHIGKILVHPRDGNTIFVAAEGPLWASGGARGLYKSNDGGQTWRVALEIDEDTGITDVIFDSTNPDILYAAAYQRRRHVWALLSGGPGSGIYKSTDCGETWRRISEGLPENDMGKIGLAVSPATPEIVYATIEANKEERGFYRSLNRGESWEKRNAYISGGTGPHYYQVIEASPQTPGLVYQMDVFIHITRNGGESFDILETGTEKHSDNHALWIDPDDDAHFLAGTDGGLYESFDQGKTWRHFPNMPLSQFYRLALDSSEPFYNILGGAQDLGTLFGPAQTSNVEGVRNQDWYVPLGADGYHVAFDPQDPNTFYLEYQVGSLFRYDRRSDELIDIQPQPGQGDPPERWNWDTPILVSPHNPHRLYVGSQRIWRSENRGDSWLALSGDLTQNQNRYECAMMGRIWSVDAGYDTYAMSYYNTITCLSESPIQEGVLYAGTDDGLIHISEDSGQGWQTVAPLPDVPEGTFISAVKASQHNADTVFAIANNHQMGDFQPYIFVSEDRGRSWQSIRGDLPDGTILWALEQDHECANLLFLGSEFGLYVTANDGENWQKLKGNVPTIPFRDIKLQRRDHDLVGASFGRGFFVLDDYRPLRSLADVVSKGEETLFPVRDAWWYVPSIPMQARGQPALGSTSFAAENPPFGATFTYYLPNKVQSAKEIRHEAEKELWNAEGDIPFPGWQELEDEALDSEPMVLLIVHNHLGEPIRTIKGSVEEGLHRVNWDLRLPPPDRTSLLKPKFVYPWQEQPIGPLTTPGRYSVTLHVISGQACKQVGSPQSFLVKPVPTTDTNTDFEEVTSFQHQTSNLVRQIEGATAEIDRARDRIRHMQAALIETPRADINVKVRLNKLEIKLAALRKQLLRDPVRLRFDEPAVPSIYDRATRVMYGHWYTRQTPTETHCVNYKIASTELTNVIETLSILIEQDLPTLEDELEAANAPWTPGRRLPRL